jgi:hypothetical protein
MKSIVDNPQFGAFVISLIVVLAFVGMLVYAMIRGIADSQVLQLLTGSLVSSFSTVIAYWIGSSSSSKGKDAVIAQQASTQANGAGR